MSILTACPLDSERHVERSLAQLYIQSTLCNDSCCRANWNVNIFPVPFRPLFFAMARECRSGRRCLALAVGVSLNNDNFRMGPHPPQSLRFFAECNQCRGGRPIPVANDPSRRCSNCRIDLDLHLFRGLNGILLPTAVLIVGITHQTCLTWRREGHLRRRLLAEPQLDPPRPRRVTRHPHHYDSSPEMDQPHRCERVARIPDHEITVLRDFMYKSLFLFINSFAPSPSLWNSIDTNGCFA